jgi:hypothetical protein
MKGAESRSSGPPLSVRSGMSVPGGGSALWAAALVIMAVGCGSHPVTSGINGQTTVDGGCPFIKPSTPCPDKPLAARIIVKPLGNDRVVASAESGPDGRFSLALAPGTYRVHADNLVGSAFPKAADVQISVLDDQYRAVAIRFDSGVRHPRA